MHQKEFVWWSEYYYQQWCFHVLGLQARDSFKRTRLIRKYVQKPQYGHVKEHKIPPKRVDLNKRLRHEAVTLPIKELRSLTLEKLSEFDNRKEFIPKQRYKLQVARSSSTDECAWCATIECTYKS